MVFIVAGLQIGAIRQVVFDVFKMPFPHTPNVVHRFITAVTRGDHIRARRMVCIKQRFGIHIIGNFDSGEFQRSRRHIDMTDQFILHLRLQHCGSPYDKRNARAFIVEKLFAARLTNPVVGNEEDYGIIEQVFCLQAVHDFAHFKVGEGYRIEIVRPVFSERVTIGIIRWQSDFVRAHQMLRDRALHCIVPFSDVA